MRSTSQAAEASSSRAAVWSMPSTAATSCAVSWCRTASSRASRCSGVVPAASGQASKESSRRRCRCSSSERTTPLTALSPARDFSERPFVFSERPFVDREIPERDGSERDLSGRVTSAYGISAYDASAYDPSPRARSSTLPACAVRRAEACAPGRFCLASASLRRQAQRASAYSQARRSAVSGPRRRSASASTSARAAVAASRSHSTDMQ